MLTLEVIEKIHHTVVLSDEDEKKIVNYIKDNPTKFEYMSEKYGYKLGKEKIIVAISDLERDGGIDMYKNETEKTSEIEDIYLIDQRTVEEILED